jgi:hypothetical protein
MNGIFFSSPVTFTNYYGSLFPQAANLAALTGYGSAGPIKRLGAMPTAIGAGPALNQYSITASGGTGYDSTIADVATKTMVLLYKYNSATTGMPMGSYGNYSGSNVGESFFQQSDTLSVTAGNGIATMSSIFTSTTKFYMVAARCTPAQVNWSYVINGVLTTRTGGTGNSYTAQPGNIRIGTNQASIYNTGSFEIAETGIWTGVTLTDAEVLQIYNYYLGIRTGQITIG